SSAKAKARGSRILQNLCPVIPAIRGLPYPGDRSASACVHHVRVGVERKAPDIEGGKGEVRPSLPAIATLGQRAHSSARAAGENCIGAGCVKHLAVPGIDKYMSVDISVRQNAPGNSEVRAL